ncbi:DUF4142 domain-containing protein [Mesorhizobium ciceri]|uniref:DUF4142 domain-containing protein n=1 Tax=Mesorhizobium ciceri biovar biserrulae (strain HAMBI 2942 / LMG 23838 / WSM1271) TaxID=765698 RepID=E8TDF9_MESCW|nr:MULTISPECIES: DUF4142 domain-containing protein [Mesorhizobium]ADV14525.1 hypothetical protein Mesci_5427 [Mesorhizobium ciceri biovar biserrulae WSM1271]AMX99111.1 hypothetical protein A4R29_06165 [Mesorhizobium ciceri biovar biserrulae]RUX78750.1 DUF4142 domain-containing protein [Mesorhizobium sp. M7A.F.Ca.US.005.03.1.1]RUY01145.1 DUF4142 domain-containing protein [Mesorhizobium sp. M7A.F.Ca.US.005.03.2.1]RUY31979.1 DUF4142 domain-containing protein [Mesorhizobium sp. M7A.F.Ca.US.001.04.
MKTRQFFASLAAASILLAVPAFAADSAQAFVDKAAIGGKFEVDSSQIALGKVQDQSIKDFAQMMIRDHGAANAKLATVAGEQKLKVPSALDAQHQGDLDKLKNAQAPIDPAYVDMQRKAHADAVKLFETYASGGDNAGLKTFAQQTVDTLKTHQQMIEKIAAGQDAITGATTPAVKTDNTPNAAALVPGANSFTEAQAKSRIEGAGYTNVSKLTKDDQGIWRGHATKAGESLAVGLDYQGNVVAASK